MTPIEIDYSRDLDALAELLASVKRPGSFFASGSIETPMPRLEIEGVGTIAFPVLDRQVKEIVTEAERAPYGRGEATLVDTRVRKVWQIAPGKIQLGGRGWQKTLDSILDMAVKGLGCEGAPVSARLYKMLIYDEGSFFVSHRDTEKTPGMFATLVVVLPSLHEGGNLVVRHSGREVTLDLGVESEDVLSRLGYAAFYADCEHELRPITKGNRVCLVYNLIRGGSRKGPGSELPQAPDYRPETAQTVEILETWAKRPEAPPKIVYLLEHQYSPAGLFFSGLKNGDAAFGSVLAEAAAGAGYAVHLGIVHIEEAGSAEVFSDPYRGSRSRWSRWDTYDDEDDEDDDSDEGEQADDDDFEIIEAYENHEFIDNWVDTQDRPVDFGKLPLAKGELLPAGALDGEKPDTQRVSEATGNEGGSYERAYHRAAIVLWHKSRYADVLLQGGAVAAIPYLKKLVESWLAAGKPSHNSKVWREIATLTQRMMQTWAVDQHRYWRKTEDESQSRCEMLAVLHATGDAVLLRHFIEEIVVRDFDGTEQEQLLASCSVLGAKATGEVFAELVTKRMKTKHKASTELLRRITTDSARGTKPSPTLTEAYRKIAGAAVKALPRIGSRPDDDRGRWSEDEPLEASTITSLLETLRNLKATKLMSAAVASIAADPKTFAPDALLVTVLESLRRTHGASVTNDKSLLRLWQHTVDFLLARSRVPPQSPTDWAQGADLDCSCKDCKELKEFAADPLEKTHRFRIRTDLRQHLHRTIEQHDLDMTHKTERRGSPYTLVCTKTRRHHQKRVKQYENDVRCLKTLVDLLGKRPGKSLDLLNRVHDALGPSAS